MSGVYTASAGVNETSAPIGARSRRLPPDNPFVGPEPIDVGRPLYGRRRETEELSNLLVGKRIVLLFSPSGAGKTSLIRAGLLTKLQRYDIQALPLIRLGYCDPECWRDATINRYRLSMLSALETAWPEAERRSTRELCEYTLQRYFDERVLAHLERDAEGTARYPLLILDQFEELFVDPLDAARKREFLVELGDLLRGDAKSRSGAEGGAAIWALFAIREDRAAELQPYLDFIPTSLTFRYRLDALGVEAGREIIRETAKTAIAGESWIEDDVPDVIVSDLSTVSVLGEDGRERLMPGPVLEPVQLQIVCRGLWEKVVKAEGRPISVGDVASHGCSEVNIALADFYDQEVAKALASERVPERALRDWIDKALISSSGVRTQCLYEPAMFGEGSCVIRRLVDAHVLRLDRRAGRDWIELPHDRLVGPVRDANSAWLAANLRPFQVRSRQWHAATGEYTRSLLLTLSELKEADAYICSHPDDVTQSESEFLEASEAEILRGDKERRLRRRVKGAWIGGGVVALGLALAWGANELAENREKKMEREFAEMRSQASRVSSNAREQNFPGAALASLLALRDEVAATPRGAPLLPSVDNAIRQQLARAPAALVRELEPRKHVVWSLAFSGDGERLFAGSWDGSVSSQDVAHPNVGSRTTPYLQSQTYALATHDATGLVASTQSDGRILLWKASADGFERLGVLVPPRKNPQHLPAVAISEDGRWLVAGGWDKDVDVWDIDDPRSPKNVASFRNGKTVVQSVVFLPGRDDAGMQRVATSDYDGDVRLWSIGPGMSAKPTPERSFAIRDHLSADIGISASAVSPSGRWFVAGDTEGNLHLWDLAATGDEAKGVWLRKAAHRASMQDPHVKGIAFLPDSSGFVSVGVDGLLIRWTLPLQAQSLADLNKTILVQRFKLQERLFSVAIRPRTPNQVAIGGTRSIFLLDLDRGPGPALSTLLPGSAGVRSWRAVSVDAAGTRIAARGGVGPIRIWQNEGQRIRSRPEWSLGEPAISNFALTPDGGHLVTVDCHGSPTGWLLRPGAAPERAATNGRQAADCDKKPASLVAISPDGRWLATSEMHVLHVYSRQDGDGGSWSAVASRALLRPDSDDGGESVGDPVSAMTFSADSRRLAVGASSGAVHLWDMTQATRRGEFAPIKSTDERMAVRALAFHPDGKSLRVGGEGGFITDYEVPTFKIRGVTLRHERAVTGLQYADATGDDARWISADKDGYLLEWKRQPSMSDPTRNRTGPMELTRRGSAPIRVIALSRDGRLLVTAGDDLLAWHLADEDIQKIARSYAQRGYTKATDILGQ